MIYQFAEGHRLAVKNANAQEVGEALEQLTANEQNFGPHLLVETARPKSSPLHKYFEWDDTEAAAQYRIEQARYLIRTVIVVRDEEPESPRIRAFVAVAEDAGRGRYVPMGRALSTPSYREKLMADAESDLARYQNKYSVLRNIDEWWVPIRTAHKVLKTKVKEAAIARAQKDKAKKAVTVTAGRKKKVAA